MKVANRHQHKKSSSTSVGARVDDVGLGGPLWSPAVVRLRTSAHPCTGDHKGPPLVHPTALAHTESSIEV